MNQISSLRMFRENFFGCKTKGFLCPSELKCVLQSSKREFMEDTIPVQRERARAAGCETIL